MALREPGRRERRQAADSRSEECCDCGKVGGVTHCPESRLALASPMRARQPPGSWIPLGNQSRAALPSEIGPEPLDSHPPLVLRLGKRHDMQDCPDEPGGEPAHAQVPTLQYGEILADDRHVAFVKIPERCIRLASLELPHDQAPDISPLLD